MQLLSLESAAQQLCARRQNIFVPTTIGLTVLRQQLELDQQMPVYTHPATIHDLTLDLGKSLGELPLRILLPADLKPDEQVPTLLYLHGGQFVTGGTIAYDKLLRELVKRARVGIIFPQFALAPEKKAPFQLEQLQQLFQRLPELIATEPLSLERLLLAGDDTGAALGLGLVLSEPSAQTAIYKMLFFCPVVNANFDTNSYHQFAGGYDLTREQMKFCWQQYLENSEQRDDNFLVPLKAPLAALHALPETLIVTAEADPVRDEGEAMGRKLRDAGVDVAQIRFQGTIHDFTVKNQLDQTNACRLAMNVAVDWLKKRR
ncbi:alpha/beta hydrolase fold domain-containing protein [Liquorilactobacillus nagelii]|jgi:acetyl esterase/lipase|uniref:alpha/beta hydrolase fold domain-containing protein n=1 Tax=Liquorilactobacillus nagelii TaxID=82688 RepID=UPI00242D581D|nr:alpha/beta hydrolase fold domain-containing protein [Liquorilactobacillus nagelii]MCI1699543.1 alpha/beta hydrolase [Liquorilactobacillus nagelii]